MAAYGNDAWCSPVYIQPGTPERLGPRDDLYFAEHPRRNHRVRWPTIRERRTYGDDKTFVVVRRSGTKAAVNTHGVCVVDREADAARLFLEA